jgi:hypothetical protein
MEDKLIEVIKNGNLKELKTLISSNGIDFDTKTTIKSKSDDVCDENWIIHKCLYYAIKERQFEILEYLSSRDVDINQINHPTSLIIAIGNKRY